MLDENLLQAAADALRNAEALMITAGAGMGVDSGLPDFRGNEGFWNAYPPYRRLGLSFSELANPRWFRQDPAFAWGFYGHRLNLYRSTQPHRGFAILRQWAAIMPAGARVFISNVDGHFQRSGFGDSDVNEIHGSIHHLQCIGQCGIGIFPADGVSVQVGEADFRAQEPLPRCPRCGGLARPNILMFGDWEWEPDRAEHQRRLQEQWLEKIRGRRLVVVELGAGSAVPTVRNFSERLAASDGARLIRINVREPEVPRGGIGLPLPALEALKAIASVL
jgi:NAD-dependent SIR2 family protein deacetylase